MKILFNGIEKFLIYKNAHIYIMYKLKYFKNIYLSSINYINYKIKEI